MPRRTGDRLSRRMLKKRPGIPVVLCTGFSDRITAQDAAAIGVKALLTKPFRNIKLVTAIREILDGQV